MKYLSVELSPQMNPEHGFTVNLGIESQGFWSNLHGQTVKEIKPYSPLQCELRYSDNDDNDVVYWITSDHPMLNDEWEELVASTAEEIKELFWEGAQC